MCVDVFVYIGVYVCVYGCLCVCGCICIYCYIPHKPQKFMVTPAPAPAGDLIVTDL